MGKIRARAAAYGARPQCLQGSLQPIRLLAGYPQSLARVLEPGGRLLVSLGGTREPVIRALKLLFSTRSLLIERSKLLLNGGASHLAIGLARVVYGQVRLQRLNMLFDPGEARL